MRYFSLTLFILLFTQGYSQDVQKVEIIKDDRQISELLDEIGNQELKLDVIDLLTQPALNVGYEKINDAYSSFGADLFLNLNEISAADSWSEKISVNPFYRFYFFNKTDFGGEGYFAEAFMKLSYLHYDRETWYNHSGSRSPYIVYQEIKTFDVASGIGIGKKWVNRKGWTFEYLIGFGRFLFSNHGLEATFKGGVSIGKRF